MSISNHAVSADVAGTPEAQAREAARQYVEQLRVVYVHATVFAVCMTGIFAVNMAVNIEAGIAGEWSAWWSIWALIGWSLGVAIHGLVVRLARPNNSPSTWTEQKINQILSETGA